MRRKVLVCLLFASIASFYALTIRPGNRWGDDFALYVHHAENIALGRPYADTGYLYNPGAPEYSPRIYPPVFPLLLAPIYRLFGLNFAAMKLEVVFFFILALVAICFYWRHALDFPYLLALLILVGFNPVFWNAKDDVLSDLPFLFFFYGAALLVQFAVRTPRSAWQWGIPSGIALYLCIGTRGIGVTLLIGLVIYTALARRRISAFTLAALASAGAILLIQRSLIGPGIESYADQFHPSGAQLRHNLLAYGHTLGAFWLVPGHRTFSIGLFALLAVLALAGACFHAEHERTVVEAFLLPYIVLVLLWPAEKGMLRFLFPAVPFFVYLALAGLQGLTGKMPRRYAVTMLAGLVALIVSSYVLAYRHMDFGPIAESDGSASFDALCRTVRQTTDATDVFIYRRARALSLFVSRPAATYKPGDETGFWDEARTLHASYVISNGRLAEDRQFLIPFVTRHPAALKLIYRNPDFELYRLRAYPAEMAQSAGRADKP